MTPNIQYLADIRRIMNEQIQALAIRKDDLLEQGSLEIQDETSLIHASETLGAIRSFLKKVESVRVFFTKPLNDHLKDINAEFKQITNPLSNLDKQITQKLKDYRQQVEAKRLEEQARLDAEAQARQETSLIPEVIAPIVPAQSKSVQTEMGKITFIKIRRWELEDISKVPLEYLKLDDAKITAVIKAGGNIPGIRPWFEEIPQSRRIKNEAI